MPRRVRLQRARARRRTRRRDWCEIRRRRRGKLAWFRGHGRPSFGWGAPRITAPHEEEQRSSARHRQAEACTRREPEGQLEAPRYAVDFEGLGDRHRIERSTRGRDEREADGIRRQLRRERLALQCAIRAVDASYRELSLRSHRSEVEPIGDSVAHHGARRAEHFFRARLVLSWRWFPAAARRASPDFVGALKTPPPGSRAQALSNHARTASGMLETSERY